MTRTFLYLLLTILFFSAGCTSQTTIANNLTEREANEIVVLLASRGVNAVKAPAAVGAGAAATATQQLWDISVPASQVTEALAILNHAGLPLVKGKSLLDLFGTSGLVPSELQDKIRYQEGLSSQLANTIRKMDGIIDANVQITFPQAEEGKQQLTASVYIKHKGILDNPNSLTVTKIKRLVASALPGLTPENVSVVTDRALYADISLEPQQQYEEQKNYVSIWSLIVEKDSATALRLILYIFIIFLFLLACALAWLIWKFWHVIKQKGGVITLFYPHQYTIEEQAPEEEAREGEE